ncbi:hypothetical protein [Roseospira goensis]|uniref:Uncharacterized protein n=1 Tax=Roseospira goensis TaxID=391922 RepID=A0A7W6WML4_9PROT|nr:hypothetical protein [Roseospira goensis]MBB4287878.1 hypothetical protein [Roseospira goensis]
MTLKEVWEEAREASREAGKNIANDFSGPAAPLDASLVAPLDASLDAPLVSKVALEGHFDQAPRETREAHTEPSSPEATQPPGKQRRPLLGLPGAGKGDAGGEEGVVVSQCAEVGTFDQDTGKGDTGGEEAKKPMFIHTFDPETGEEVVWKWVVVSGGKWSLVVVKTRTCTLRCKHCGKEFVPPVHQRRTYCSPECSEEGQKKRVREAVRRWKQRQKQRKVRIDTSARSEKHPAGGF